LIALPANAVADLEQSGLFAGHLVADSCFSIAFEIVAPAAAWFTAQRSRVRSVVRAPFSPPISAAAVFESRP
jgi:hypothetical protein